MTINISATSTNSTITEVVAQRTANGYLATALGSEYHALHGFYGKGRWHFLIHHRRVGDQASYGVGKIVIDGATGKVNALTDDQLRDAREAGLIQVANARREMARDEQGYLLRYQAQMKATEWLTEHLTMHFSASDGMFIPLLQPLWQFSICLRLPRSGELKPFGVIDVDARDGQVKPLSHHQQQSIQERAREIIRHRQLAAAA